MVEKFSSADFWEKRYASGGNSGKGSYISALRSFKNDVLLQIIKANKIRSIIDWGCGDGHQLQDLSFDGCYLGIDVSKTAVEKCRTIFDGRPNFSFIESMEYLGQQASLGISLDVIYHLVEDNVFEGYMERLCDSSMKYMLIYSSNGRKVEKPAEHLLERNFIEWIENNRPEWKLQAIINNSFPYQGGKSNLESISDFYFFKRS